MPWKQRQQSRYPYKNGKLKNLKIRRYKLLYEAKHYHASPEIMAKIERLNIEINSYSYGKQKD